MDGGEDRGIAAQRCREASGVDLWVRRRDETDSKRMCDVTDGGKQRR